MKAKDLKHLLSSIPDDSEIGCVYSCELFGNNTPELYSSERYAGEFYSDYGCYTPKELESDINADYIIAFT